MKKIYGLFFVVILLIGFGCGSPDKKISKDGQVVNISLNEKEHILNMSAIIDSLEYIPLETTSENLIGNIAKLIPLQDKIIVVDNENAESVYMFDNQGKYIMQIANKGAAPGEYVSLSSVAVDEAGNRIFIYDGSTGNVLIYSLNGEYIDQFRINFVLHEIEYAGNDRLACYCDYANEEHLVEKGMKPNLILLDLKQKKTKGYLYVDKRISMSEITAPYLAMSRYSPNNDATLFFPLETSIYRVSADGVKEECYLNFGEEDEKKRQSYIKRLVEENLSAIDIYEKYQPDFCDLSLCVKGKDILYVNYTNQKNGIIGWGVYRFTDQKYIGGYAIAKYPVKNDLDNFFPLMPVAAKDNKLYGVVDASLLETVKDPENKRIQELKKTLTSEDNPIIMIGYVKVK